MTLLATRECACQHEYYSGKRPERCECGHRLLTAAQLNPKPRKPLKRTTELASTSIRRKSSSGKLRQGRGFAASPAQQRKVKNLPCVVCGRDRHEGVEIHAAHVYPRRFQHCDCPEGVVPLCSEHHRLADDQNESFDLMPHLVGRKYHAELVHAVAVHQVPIGHLLEQVTGLAWEPVEREAVGA